MDETLNKIENLIATAEKFRSSYFWKAPTSAPTGYPTKSGIPSPRSAGRKVGARSVVLIGRDDVDRFLEAIG